MRFHRAVELRQRARSPPAKCGCSRTSIAASRAATSSSSRTSSIPGLTLSYLQDILRAREPRSLRTACLLSKPSRRKVDVRWTTSALRLKIEFVVGYGLDLDERYRHLPDIGVMRRGRVMAVRPVCADQRGRRPTIEPGSTVELEPGGHVTPLARDTLRARRVTVVPAGTVDPTLPADLAPISPTARVAIGVDHSGVALKATLIDHLRKRARP